MKILCQYPFPWKILQDKTYFADASLQHALPLFVHFCSWSETARRITTTPKTHWRMCSLGKRRRGSSSLGKCRVLNPTFNDHLSFQHEGLAFLRSFEAPEFIVVVEGKQGDAELIQASFWHQTMSKLRTHLSLQGLDYLRDESAHVSLTSSSLQVAWSD